MNLRLIIENFMKVCANAYSIQSRENKDKGKLTEYL